MLCSGNVAQNSFKFTFVFIPSIAMMGKITSKSKRALKKKKIVNIL